MKFAGWRCSSRLSLLIGTVLLAALPTASPLAAQQTPSPATTVSQNAPLLLAFALPDSPAPSVNDKLAQLDKDVKAAQSSADNAWMLVSAALVLMMTGPGLALFYGGLLRRKNTLAIMIQSFALMALITVLWGIVGYSLCFREGTAVTR